MSNVQCYAKSTMTTLKDEKKHYFYPFSKQFPGMESSPHFQTFYKVSIVLPIFNRGVWSGPGFGIISWETLGKELNFVCFRYYLYIGLL